MAHDFAKSRPRKKATARTQKNKPTAKKTSSSSHWSWFFSGLLCGLLFAFAAYTGILKVPTIQQVQIVETDEETGAPIIEAQPEFEFYEYLAETEVQVDVVPVAIISEIDAIPVNYLLQAGSFQVRQDAENRLAKVILLNMDASIVPGVVAGKTWYRVQAGPFAGKKIRESARDVLSSNNIDTFVLELRERL